MALEAGLLNPIGLGLEAAELPGGSRWSGKMLQHLQILLMSKNSQECARDSTGQARLGVTIPWGKPAGLGLELLLWQHRNP